MRIDFFRNDSSAHEVLGYFTKGLQEALRRHRIGSALYDMNPQSESEVLAHFVKDNTQYTAGFNVLLGEHSYFEPLGIPHIALIVDCVTYCPSLIDSPHTIACFVDEDSCDFIRLLGHDRTLYLPHAVEKEAIIDPVNLVRDFDVTFCGTFIDPDAIVSSWRVLFSPGFVQFLEGVAERALCSVDTNHMSLIMNELNNNYDLSKELKEKKVPLYDIMNSVERVYRGRDRIGLIGSLRDVTLHIFDHAQNEARWRNIAHTNLVFHSAVSFQELLPVFRRSKVLLNSMPMFKRGFHERLFYGIASGASVITTENVAIPADFPASKAVLYYRPPDYAQVNATLAIALANEEERLQDILSAQKIVRKKHTWDQRVKKLKEFLTTQSLLDGSEVGT